MIEITTVLTEAVYRQFYAFTLFRSRNPRFRRFVFLGLLPAISVGIMLLNLMRPGMIVGYIVGLIGLALFGGFLYVLGPGVRGQYAALPPQLKVPQHITFGEEDILARCSYEGEDMESRYDYGKMAVQETQDALYIFVAANQAILLPKADLGGRLAEVQALLHEKLPEQHYMLCFKPAGAGRKKED